MKVFASAINYGLLASGANTVKFRAIYSGATGGDIVVTPKGGGTPVTFASFPAGQILPVEGSAVTAPSDDLVWMNW